MITSTVDRFPHVLKQRAVCTFTGVDSPESVTCDSSGDLPPQQSPPAICSCRLLQVLIAVGR